MTRMYGFAGVLLLLSASAGFAQSYQGKATFGVYTVDGSQTLDVNVRDSMRPKPYERNSAQPFVRNSHSVRFGPK